MRYAFHFMFIFKTFVMEEAVKGPQQDIANGPGKFDLMLSLMDGKEVIISTHPTGELKGKLLINKRRKIVIQSLTPEDGTRNKWIFTGFERSQNKIQNVEGYYDLHGKKGHLYVIGEKKTFQIKKRVPG